MMTEAVPDKIRERHKDLIALLHFVSNSAAMSPGPESTANPQKGEIVAELNAIGEMYPSLDPKIDENPIHRAIEVMREDEEVAAHLNTVPEHEWNELADEVADLYDGGPYWIVDPEEYDA